MLTPEIMTSKEDFFGGETSTKNDDDLSLSSKGGVARSAITFCKGPISPPNIPQGFVMVLDDSYRARYRPVKAPKDSPFYVCLNKSTYHSLHGVQHPVLRNEHREEPGMYKDIYGVKGKIVAAESGTLTTHKRVEEVLGEQ